MNWIWLWVLLAILALMPVVWRLARPSESEGGSNCSHDLGLKPGDICSRCGEPVGIQAGGKGQ